MIQMDKDILVICDMLEYMADELATRFSEAACCHDNLSFAKFP